MLKYYFILTILFSFFICIYAQENINLIKILNIEQDIVSLEKEIAKLIKEDPEMANMQNLRQFHIPNLKFDGNDLQKEDYLNHSFLYHFKPRFYDFVFKRKNNKLISRKLKEKYLMAETLVTDSEGNLICLKINRMKGCLTSLDYAKLAKMLFNKEFDLILSLPYTLSYMVGIKGNNLYAIEKWNEFKVYTWEEFIECCFDKWIVP
jgi:hypothetical protein